MMGSDSTTFSVLQNALYASNLQQQVYANNIANADTPGYKRQDVDFESLLSQAMNDQSNSAIPTPTTPGAESSIASVQPVVYTDTSGSVDNTGNNVDINAEMSRLAENQIRYNALIQDVQDRLSRMQTAITD